MMHRLQPLILLLRLGDSHLKRLRMKISRQSCGNGLTPLGSEIQVMGSKLHSNSWTFILLWAIMEESDIYSSFVRYLRRRRPCSGVCRLTLKRWVSIRRTSWLWIRAAWTLSLISSSMGRKTRTSIMLLLMHSFRAWMIKGSFSKKLRLTAV